MRARTLLAIIAAVALSALVGVALDEPEPQRPEAAHA